MRIAVIGLGLIGGSLLRAAAAAGHDVVGFDADPATRDLAGAAGFRVADSVAAAVRGAEVTALAVPLPVLPQVLSELAGHDGLVTDVTSVKGPVRELARRHGLRRFVGGHPMAGKETSGFAAGEAGLFDGCVWALCLEPDETDLADWLIMARLCTSLRARVAPVTAAEHDTAVARISHVPHLLAAALTAQIGTDPLAGALAAGSFRDGTRVAGTRPELIAAMCGGNADAVRRELLHVIVDLQALAAELERVDPVAALLPYLSTASGIRRAWPATPGKSERVTADVSELLALGRAGGWVQSVIGHELTILRPETDLYNP